MTDLQQPLVKAAKLLKVELIGEPHQGFNLKSVSSKVIRSTGSAWLKVIKVNRRPVYLPPVFSFSPQLLQTIDFQYCEQSFLAQLFPFVEQSAVASSPFLTDDVKLPNEWYIELRSTVEQIQNTPVHTISPALNHASDHISSVYKERLATPLELVAIHGDLHWANLTQLPITIFDWDYFGQGPRGYDIAFLLCLGLGNTDVVNKLHEYFGDWLQSPSGLWSQIFACSRIVGLYKKQESYSALLSKVRQYGQSLV